MEVNLSKTEIVVFRPEGMRPQPGWQWQYQGQPVPVSSEFKYLGIVFHETEGVSVAEGVLCGAARRAMWAMIGKFRVAQIRDISLKLRMFQSLVTPIMDYCSAVWCPALLSDCSSNARVYGNSMQQVQSTFLRQLGHLRRTTPLAILHREFCLEPIAGVWLRSLTQLWQRLQSAPAESLLGRVSRAALHLAQTGSAAVRRACWAGQFFNMIKSFSKHGRDGDGRLSAFAEQFGWTAPRRGHFLHVHQKLVDLPWCPFWNAWDSLVQQPWTNLPQEPREVPQQGPIKYATYHRWFALPVPSQLFQWDRTEGQPRMPVNMPAYVKCTRWVPFDQLKQLIRLRTGAHHLTIETGRWQRRARDSRVCCKCSASVVEDEMHLLFECPAYQQIRTRFSAPLFGLFGGVHATLEAVKEPGGFCQFMEQDPKQVAAFVSACMTLRQEEAASESTSDGYGSAQSSSLLQESQEYYSACSVFSCGDEEVTGRPMEPRLAPETGAPPPLARVGANL